MFWLIFDQQHKKIGKNVSPKMYSNICLHVTKKRIYIYHYTLKPALKSIKLKHSPTGCFVNRLVRGFFFKFQIAFYLKKNPLTSLLTKQPVWKCFSFIDFSAGFNV